MGTYEGMAVPLFGGYTACTSSGTTACLTVTDIGARMYNIVLEATPTNKLGTADWPSMYGGFMFKTATGASAYSTKFLSSVISVFDYNATDANLSAAGMSILEVDDSAVISGGRLAVHMFVCDSGADRSGNIAAFSWLDFEETNTSYPVPTFLTLEIAAVGSGCFEAITTSTATHGLVMYHNNTKYWIMVCDSSKE